MGYFTDSLPQPQPGIENDAINVVHTMVGGDSKGFHSRIKLQKNVIV